MKNQTPIWVSIIDGVVLGPLGKILSIGKYRPSMMALILHDLGRNIQNWVEERYCKICYVQKEKCPSHDETKN